MSDTDLKPERTPLMISFKQIGLLIIALFLGFASFGLLQNALGGQALTFSTPALLGFAISIVLAGSSTVLAVTAIMLGKFSEQAMIQRSDDSIRLQNEVFQKTTDALQRIESSTGVTEKRLEDIISGRVGDISHRIAEIATEGGKGVGERTFSEIEEKIRNSLLETLRKEQLRPSKRPTDEEKRKRLKEREIRRKQYLKCHERVMSAFANRDDLKMRKAGLGTVGTTGDDLFDGIFSTAQGNRVTVSTFIADFDSTQFQGFLRGVLSALYGSPAQQSFFVLFSAEAQLTEIYEENVKLLASELKERIHLLIIGPDDIEKTISELKFSNKALQATSEPAPSAAPEAPVACRSQPP